MAKYFVKEGDDYKEVEAFSQDSVNEIVGERVKREREKFADYDGLKTKAESVDSLKSDYEGKLKQAAEEKDSLTKQLGAAKLETDKVKIMHEFKLADDMSEFVTGENADEMRKRAERLAKGIGGSGKVVVRKDGKPKDGETATDSKKIAGKLFGSKSDD